jgi:pimeloyl-ACP methyl ester carboxylesterase
VSSFRICSASVVLGGAACPVLVRGEQDRVAPAALLEGMARRIPDAHIVTVAGASHTLVYTDPRTLAELVMERFSSLPS